MASLKNTSLYFIALVPPEPYYSMVVALKEEMKERFASRAALRSPPHITLHMPFRWKPAKEERLISALDQFVKQRKGFELDQSGFGAFDPRVIFVNVENTGSLRSFQKELLSHIRKTLSIENPNYKNQGFHPHMTIAFRDLKKPAFAEAWKEFQLRTIEMQWVAKEIVLLKHDGLMWNIYKTFSLD